MSTRDLAVVAIAATLAACTTNALPAPLQEPFEKWAQESALDRCAGVAAAAADDVRAAGGDDGGARRAADETLDRCQRAAQAPAEVAPPRPPCATEENRADTHEPPGAAVVHFVCGAETPQVRWLPRPEIDGTDPLAVFRALLSGPTAAERERGYEAALIGEPDAVLSATITDGVLTLDFAGAPFGPSAVGTSNGTAAFIAQVRWTAFGNLDDVDEVLITVDGDCGNFGGVTEIGGCVTLLRAGGQRVT